MIYKFITLASSHALLRGSKFVFFLAMTNILPKYIVAEYSYFTAIFSIVFVFSDFGIQTFLTKDMSTKKLSILHIQLAWFRIIAFIVCGLFISLIYWQTGELVFVFVLLVFLSETILAMHLAHLRAKEASNQENIIHICTGLAYMLMSILIFLKVDVAIVFLCFGVFLFLFSVKIGFFVKLNFLYYFLKSLDFEFVKIVLRKSTFIFVGSLATLVYLRIDIIMIELFEIKDAVIYYAIASRILELSLIVPSVISVILLPVLSKIKTTTIKTDFALHFAIGVCVMLFFFAVSHYIIDILFHQFEQTLLVLYILLCSIPFMLVNNYAFTYLVANSHSKYYAYTTCFMAILNVLLNAIFIAIYGYKAAVYTTVLTEVVGSCVSIYYIYKII